MINPQKIRLSRHARRQIKWRRITEKELRDAIAEPDRSAESMKGRKNVFKSIGNRLLKITYKVENDVIIIITAMVKGEK